jgi:DNA excision repair protein ERCC-4
MRSEKPRPVIVVDTREQMPYMFPATETVKAALPAGDYSLLGYETEIAVERKTVDDFVHTVIHDRERFEREIEKLTHYRRACIVVESDLYEIRYGKYHSKAHPNSILGTMIALFVDTGIPVFTASNRQCAEWLVHGILLRYWKNKNEKLEVCREVLKYRYVDRETLT